LPSGMLIESAICSTAPPPAPAILSLQVHRAQYRIAKRGNIVGEAAPSLSVLAGTCPPAHLVIPV